MLRFIVCEDNKDFLGRLCNIINKVMMMHAPMKPFSSPSAVNMKSVFFSGKKSSDDCVPFKNPFPQKPPDPTAIFDCIMWYPVPNGSRSGFKNVSTLFC